MQRVKNPFEITVLLSLSLYVAVQTGMAQTGPCATVVAGQPLPDLTVDGKRLRSDIIVTTESFAQHACAVVEGCVSSRGKHQLLRFTTATPNIGEGDMVIGDPFDCPSLFDLSECHNHLHFHEYADYRLWTEAGFQMWEALRQPTEPTNTGYNAQLLENAIANGELIVGRKQGFCMIDIERYEPDAPETKKYTLCGSLGAPGNQGLQSGWSDVYGQQLDCQFIEIDRLRSGVYVLENHVNPEQLLPETNYGNNTASVKFEFIQGKGKSPGQVIIQENQ